MIQWRLKVGRRQAERRWHLYHAGEDGIFAYCREQGRNRYQVWHVPLYGSLGPIRLVGRASSSEGRSAKKVVELGCPGQLVPRTLGDRRGSHFFDFYRRPVYWHRIRGESSSLAMLNETAYALSNSEVLARRETVWARPDGTTFVETSRASRTSADLVGSSFETPRTVPVLAAMIGCDRQGVSYLLSRKRDGERQLLTRPALAAGWAAASDAVERFDNLDLTGGYDAHVIDFELSDNYIAVAARASASHLHGEQGSLILHRWRPGDVGSTHPVRHYVPCEVLTVAPDELTVVALGHPAFGSSELLLTILDVE